MGRKKLSDEEKKERQRQRDAAREQLRDRWISFVCFDEILHDDLIPKLSSLGVPYAISPVHDHDINDDGSPKKPHRHVLFHYSAEKYLSTLYNELGELFGRESSGTDGSFSVVGIPYPQKLFGTPNGLIRYFKHLDNPDKYQYSEDPEGYCGFDVNSYLYSSGDINEMLRVIFALIEEYDLSYPHQFINVCLSLDRKDLLYAYFNQKTYLINSILAGKRHYIGDQRAAIAQAAQENKKRP